MWDIGFGLAISAYKLNFIVRVKELSRWKFCLIFWAKSTEDPRVYAHIPEARRK